MALVLPIHPDSWVEIEGEEVKNETLEERFSKSFNHLRRHNYSQEEYDRQLAKIAKEHYLSVFDEAVKEYGHESDRRDSIIFIRERLEGS